MPIDTEYRFEIVDESDIAWSLHNQIHQLLNFAYHGLTKQFECKTYAYMRPDKRLLVFNQNNELIGHCGLVENEIINCGDQPIKVGGIGLMASHAKSVICRNFLQRAIEFHAENGLQLSIGYCSNPRVIKHIVSKVGSHVLDAPTIGNHSQTKPTDKTVIFPATPSFDVSKILSLKEIRLAKEIF